MTPIRELLGLWSVFLLNTVRRQTYLRYCEAIERFLEKFPRKTSPQMFDRCDVEDYKTWRRAEGVAESSLKFEIAVVSSFWSWMIETRGLHLLNIASKKTYRFF